MKISDGEEQSWVFLVSVLVILPRNHLQWAEGRPAASSCQSPSGHRGQGVGTLVSRTQWSDADMDLGDVLIPILTDLEKAMKNKCT